MTPIDCQLSGIHTSRRRLTVRAPWLIPILASSVALPVVGQPPQQTSESVETQLILDAVATYPIPESFPVSGAAMSPGGAIVAWSPLRPELLLFIDDQPSFISSPHLRHPVAAAFTADGHIEAVDSTDTALVEFDVHGTVLNATRLRTEGHTMLGAAYAGNAWTLLLQDGAGATILQIHARLLGAASPEPRIVRLDPSITFRRDIAWIQVQANGIILSTWRPPFEALTIDVHSEVTRQFETAHLPITLPDSLRAQPDRWVSLKTLPLGEGYVRTLADTRGDERVIVVYDGRGRVVRRGTIPAAFGILSTSTVRRELLAIRTLNESTLVRYAWYWNGGDS